MLTLEEYKKKWSQRTQDSVYDQKAMEAIVQERTRREKNTLMRYFWGAFVLQLIVYALLSHVIARYLSDATSVAAGISGILLFLPFTIILLTKFKAMAVNRPNTETSLYGYVSRQYALLRDFYRFKRLYEFLLIPLATAIGTFLVFHLYFPGGVLAFPSAALTTFIVTLVSCVWVIADENTKYFRAPLKRLENVLAEYRLGES